MSLDEFETWLVRHGTAEGGWPPAQRGTVHALLLASPEARAMLADARAVDALLRDLPATQAPATLKADIMARLNAEIVRAAAPPAAVPVLQRFSLWRFWPQAVGFVAASLLGIMLGLSSLSPLPDDMADSSGYVLGFDGDAVTVSMNEGQ